MNSTNKLAFKILSASLLAAALSACGGHGSGANSNTTPTCSNPISINDPSLSPLTQQTDFPSAKFKLSKLQLYEVSQATGDSFTVSASSADQFSTVHVDCNGMNNSNETLLGLAAVPDSIDFTKDVQSSSDVALGVKLVGKDVTDSNVAEVSNSSQSNSFKFPIHLQQKSAGNGLSVTERYYLVSSTRLEGRIKTKDTTTQTGKPIVQYIQAVYDKN